MSRTKKQSRIKAKKVSANFAAADKSKEDKINTYGYAEIAYANAAEAMFGSSDKMIQKYNPSLLLSTKGFPVLDKMRRDDQIKAAMTFKKNAVVANGWEIVSPEGQESDWEVTKFVMNNLKDMDGTFERRLINIMTAMDYGFSVTEKVFKPKDGKIVLSAIKTKRPHDITFSADNYGNLTAIHQYAKDLPIDKFIVYSYEMEFDNWYGTPDLEASYRAWWTKDNTYKWMAMLLERMGIPPIFAMYNPDRYKGAQLSNLRDVLNNLQAATTASIPTWNDKDSGKSIEFWTPELAKNIGDVFIPALDMLNRDIARSILMPGLLGATPDEGVGSQARSTVHFDVFMLVIEKIRSEIEEYIMQEQIIKPLVDLNFNVTEYPQFRFMPLTDDLRVELIDKWIGLINANVVRGQPDDEEHIRKLFNFPERDASENIDEDTTDIIDNSKGSGSVDIVPTDNLPDTSSNHNHICGMGKEYAVKTKRELNSYEKKVDFKAIINTITTHENTLTTALKSTLTEEQDYLIKQLRKPNVDIAELSIRPTLTKKLGVSFKESMTGISKAGSESILSLRTFKVGSVASVADRWIKSRASAVAGVMSNKLQDSVLILLSNAIRSGVPLGEVIAQIQDLFAPYIGNENVIEDDNVIDAFRVETIVRTNLNTAYNQGRLVAIRDPDVQAFIHGVEYSAILDDRTTEICEFLDGRVFKVDDPELDRLTPPNHMNCRSVLIPIMIDEPIKKEDFLGAKDIGKARELAGKGFA